MSDEEEPIILMSREQSTMLLNWDEMLCLTKRATGKWYVGIYGYKSLGNIYDLIPEDQQVYDEDGRIVPPKELNGRPVFDVKDEFVLTDELVERKEGVVFDVATLEIARDYIREHGWDKYDEFRTAWDRLNKLVS